MTERFGFVWGLRGSRVRFRHDGLAAVAVRPRLGGRSASVAFKNSSIESKAAFEAGTPVMGHQTKWRLAVFGGLGLLLASQFALGVGGGWTWASPDAQSASAEAMDALTAPAAADPEASAEPSASFLARAQQHIAEREYWASENDRGLQAPNRRHGLRTYFGSNGIRVEDRTAMDSPGLLSLRLSAYGREARGLAPASCRSWPIREMNPGESRARWSKSGTRARLGPWARRRGWPTIV